jgi:creatinine amidohydrolase
MATQKKAKKKTTSVLKLEEMNWKEIDALARHTTIFFLPISPLEQHGPHLPVGTDYMTAKDATVEAIKKIQKEAPELTPILLPAIPLGYCDFCLDFPGSFSVSGKTVRDIVLSIGTQLARHGFLYLIICTYHMSIVHLKGIYSAMEKLRSKHELRVYEPWGPYFHGNQIQKREPKLGFDTSKEVHAGFRETSLVKYQYPYLVDESYKKLQSIYRDLSSPRTLGKTFKELGLTDGYVGSPAKADVSYGRWFFTETVNSYAEAAIKIQKGQPLPDLPKKSKNAMKALFWH